MRIEQLEYIAAVTRHGSLRRASEHLHISQPALSEAVSKLERELGVNLLDRHRSGARISEAGRALLQDMTDVLDAVDRLRANAGRPRRSADAVTLATCGAATPALLGSTLRDFADTLPDTQVEVISARPVEVLEGLAEGSIHLGLLDLLPSDDLAPELARHTVATGVPVAVLHPSHPLALEPLVTITQLRSCRFVAMRAGHLMHRLTHRLLGPNLPEAMVAVDDIELATEMVAQDLGVALLPDFSVIGDPLETTGRVVIRPLAPRSPSTGSNHDRTIDLAVLGRRETTHSMPVKALIKALRERSGSARTPSAAAVDRGLSTG